MSTFELDVDLAEGIGEAVALGHQTIVGANRPNNGDQGDDQQSEQDDPRGHEVVPSGGEVLDFFDEDGRAIAQHFRGG